MSLLDKFNTVVIQADNRISETDRDYCETQQKAYEAAISSYKELSFFWEDMCRTQEELLGPKSGRFHTDYLDHYQGIILSNHSIREHIKSLHSTFINAIVYYFNEQYHVTVSCNDVQDALLPQKPDSYRCEKEDLNAYAKTMQDLIVKYADVVDQIILRLDGRSFMEQAFYELKTNCHNAAWNTYKKESKFERKKDTIRFKEYFCSCDTWLRWELNDSMICILRGAAHFETGLFNYYPAGFSTFLTGYNRFDVELFEFSSCTKIKQMKLFKNGRVDLKFASEALAAEFIDTYLGTVC